MNVHINVMIEALIKSSLLHPVHVTWFISIISKFIHFTRRSMYIYDSIQPSIKVHHSPLVSGI